MVPGVEQELVMTEISLHHLKGFTESFTQDIGPILDDSVLWGTVGLVLKVSKYESFPNTALSEIFVLTCCLSFLCKKKVP